MRAANPETRKGHNNNGTIADNTPVRKGTNVLASVVPPVPAGLGQFKGDYLVQAESLWNTIWEAGGDFYVAATDAHIIERYVSLQVRRAKLLATLEHEGYVTVGSQGQDVAHPAARLVLDIEGKLPPLEDRLGLSPEARLRLGLAAAETKSRLDKFREDEVG